MGFKDQPKPSKREIRLGLLAFAEDTARVERFFGNENQSGEKETPEEGSSLPAIRVGKTGQISFV